MPSKIVNYVVIKSLISLFYNSDLLIGVLIQSITMEILETAKGVVLNLYIKPGSNNFKIKIDDNKLLVWCHERPLKGKVNKELLYKFSQIFGQKVELISGFTSKQKKILINNIDSEKVIQILNSI